VAEKSLERSIKRSKESIPKYPKARVRSKSKKEDRIEKSAENLIKIDRERLQTPDKSLKNSDKHKLEKLPSTTKKNLPSLEPTIPST